MSALDSFTEEQLEKAFEIAKNEIQIPVGKLVRITKEYYQAALDFVRDEFNVDEPVTSHSNVEWCTNVQHGWIESLDYGTSLMILDESTNTAMAIRITRVHKSWGNYGFENITDEGLKTVWKLIEYGDEKGKLCERFKVDEALHMFGLGVGRKYVNKGLGTKIVEAALVMYKNLGIKPICIKVEASNNYSRLIYDKLGFTRLYHLPYNEYKVDGKLVYEDMGIHKAITFYGKMLNEGE